MRSRISILLILTMTAAATASADVDFLDQLLHWRPRGYISEIGGADHPKKKAEFPRAAQEWRLKTMVSEDGRIPPGAFYRAAMHRRNMPKKRSRPGQFATLSASIWPGAWTPRGPQNIGGRTLALVVHPLNNQILFAGSASGGMWKSIDAGQTWTPVNDFMANLSIGALAFDPLNANTMYAGTGERFYSKDIRNSGLFRSTNGGTTWTQLANTANWADVQMIAPRPGSSNTILVATGDGIWRTDDATAPSPAWVHVLGPPAIHAALTVAFDPTGTRAVAGARRADTNTVRAYYSTDGGLTFNLAVTGPSMNNPTETGDVAVAFAPSQPSTVYAVANDGSDFYSEFWRSTDFGVNYTRINTGQSFGCLDRRCPIWVSPNDPNMVVTGGYHHYRTMNGGTTFTQIDFWNSVGWADPHVDQHCITQDSMYNGTTNRRVYVCTDGGVWRTDDIQLAAQESGSWTALDATYQTTQYYGAAGHAAGLGAYIGGTQDNGTLLTTNFSNAATPLHGADGGFVEIDPTAVNTWYYSTQLLNIYRTFDGGANEYRLPINDLSNFIVPFILDPNDSDTLYAGGRSLWRSNSVTAPIATFSAVRGPGAVPISAIAVVPGNSDIVYVGQNDGIIQKTINGTAPGPTWTNVDNNVGIDPLPDRYVTRIYCDPGNPDTVYVGLGGFNNDNLWKSTNGGATFVSISGGLPQVPVRGIVRHPRNSQRLYIGTDVGIFESENGGQTWLASESGPADVVVDELRYVVGTETLLAATHGRGLWTADTSSVPPDYVPPPTGLSATASGTTSVSLSWTGVSGATSYQILRSNNHQAYVVAGTASGTTHVDSTVVAGATYLYTVKAVVNSVSSNPSNVDFATTIAFTHNDALAGKTIIATYLQEIRNATNAVRAAAGLGALTFTNPAVPGSTIQANDISQLRTGLIGAYNQLGLTPPAFAETLVAGSTVKASHWQEIRNAVK